MRIEVDTGFGRCGVQTPEDALALAREIDGLPGVRLVGVMSFGGQTYRAPPEGRRGAALEDAARLVGAAELLRASGFEAPEVSVGSTPSAAYVGEMPGVTELRPGTYVFSDRDQAGLGWGTLDDCALTIAATVVSRPTPTRAIIDAGTKTLSGDRATTAEGWGDVRGHPDWAIESLSEEHGVMSVPAPGGPAIGTQIDVIPNHACAALNLHDEVTVVRDGAAEDVWSVQGRGLVR